MVNRFLFKDRDGQTPLPEELRKGLKIKTIQTVGELDIYEEKNIAAGLSWLEKRKTNFRNHSLWLKLHKSLFGNVWSWAGKVRQHELNNPDFAEQSQIWTEIRKLEGDLTFWLEEGIMPDKEILARFHERLLTIHPFPNGNGRWSRILTERISSEEKMELPTWGSSMEKNPGERRQAYIGALDRARQQGDYSKLISFMFN